MIDSHHPMAPLVAHLMHSYRIRESCAIAFPTPGRNETPAELGFRKVLLLEDGLVEEWRQDARLSGERAVIMHLTKTEADEWRAYLTLDWRQGPYEPDHPAVGECLSIAKRVACLIGATQGWSMWKMHDRRVGDFTGEVVLADGGQGGDSGDESIRLARIYVTDESFRIAWYADRIEGMLYQALDTAKIVPLPNVPPRGRSKLKNPMLISRTISEATIPITPLLGGLDAYDFCE